MNRARKPTQAAPAQSIIHNIHVINIIHITFIIIIIRIFSFFIIVVVVIIGNIDIFLCARVLLSGDL